MTPRLLHRRLVAAAAAAALLAFLSGAGTDMPAAFVALAVVLLVAVRPPAGALSARLEPLLRLAAPLLAARAGWALFFGSGDAVLPMVDLLLLLLAGETLRQPNGTGDARIYSLSLALFVAAAAYRPGVVFLVGFVAYVVIATVALVVGQIARQAERHGDRRARVSRALLLRTAALAAVPLLVAATVFATFPRVTRSWMTRAAPVEHAVVGFADQVSLGTHGSRIHPNPAVALRVEFPAGTPAPHLRLYWRGRSYDRFDGVRWSRSSGAALRVPPAPTPVGPLVEQRIYGARLEQPVLFGLPTIIEVDARSRMRVVRERGDDWSYLGAAAPVYRVASSVAEPDPGALRTGDYVVPVGLAAYLQLPELSPRLHALADSLARAGATPYERARALERWFHRGFAYTLELPRTPAEATLEHFLFARRAGHCEYFSSAMVMLLRAQGIAARNVNGFLGGEWNEVGNFLTVTQNQAHSWVEAWFPEVGWVTFDPTPAALTHVAAAQRDWRAAFRSLADGLEHRWSKWVLDYDLEKQVALLRRTTDAFAASDAARAPSDRRGSARAVGLILIAIVLAAAVLRAIVPALRRPRSPGGEATRVYLALRRLYGRAGFDVPRSAGPFAFARALRQAGAPGAEAAARAVAVYAELRFGAGAMAPEVPAGSAAGAGAGLAVRPAGERALRADPVADRLHALRRAAAEARQALRQSRRRRWRDGFRRDPPAVAGAGRG